MNKTELLNLGYTDFAEKLIDDESLPFFSPLDKRDIFVYVQNEKQQGRLDIFKKVVAEKFYDIFMKILWKFVVNADRDFEHNEDIYLVNDIYTALYNDVTLEPNIFLKSRGDLSHFFHKHLCAIGYFGEALDRYYFLLDTISEQATKPQQVATEQADEAKHYNYTLTTEQQQLMFDELKNNGYIAHDTDFNNFCFAISGTPIKTDFVPINWLPMLKDLYCFLSEFFAAEKANKQKAVYCFVWQKKPIKIKSLTNLNFSNGEPPSANYFKELKKQISEV